MRCRDAVTARQFLSSSIEAKSKRDAKAVRKLENAEIGKAQTEAMVIPNGIDTAQSMKRNKKDNYDRMQNKPYSTNFIQSNHRLQPISHP
jgi:hypothetical protein